MQGEDDGPELLQELVGAAERHAQLAGLEVYAGRKAGEARADERLGGRIPGDLPVTPRGILQHAVEVGFDALAAGDFGGEAAVLAHCLEPGDEILPPADKGAARAFLRAALPQDAPGGPLADAEH